jgi:uncharacterized protein (TIGR03118 family)
LAASIPIRSMQSDLETTMTSSMKARALGCAGMLFLAGCGGGGYDTMPSAAPASAPQLAEGGYTLVDVRADLQLASSWGLAFSDQGVVWVNNNATSTAAQYTRDGAAVPPVVPFPGVRFGELRPTGVVANSTNDFHVTRGNLSGPCTFIVAGESGALACWAPTVNALQSALVVVDSEPTRAIYKALAIATRGNESFLYAADFRGAAVDVFDGEFNRIAGTFDDPLLPAGFAPFGMQTIGDEVYVAYAKRDPQTQVELAGAGMGLVNVFDTAGNLIRRLIPAGGKLNAPWGIARAPAGFGAFGGALLIANSGDGTINAFDAVGTFLGSLRKPDGSPIVIDGLRGIAFDASAPSSLYFVAGRSDGLRGVFGRIDAH